MNTPGSRDRWGQGSYSQGDFFPRLPSQMQDGSQNSIYGNMSDTTNQEITTVPYEPDPFLGVPSRPFYTHSVANSVESIATIVDEKANSPLNKVMASVSPTFSST
jgi:alpha-1,3-glucan synthase